MADIQSAVTVFANGGQILKSAPDEIPITAYKALWNMSTTRENTLTVRKGVARLNDGLPDLPHSSFLLVDYLNRKWRYAIVDGQLYVTPLVDPDDESVWPLASGTDFGAVEGGDDLSEALDPRAIFTTGILYGTETKPYIFFADGVQFLKHPGGLASARRVGIPKPYSRIISGTRGTPATVEVEACEDVAQWTAGSFASSRPVYQPAIWWYGTRGVADQARYLYFKHTFALPGDEESGPGDLSDARYIPKEKLARFFWKEQTATYSSSTAYGGAGGNAYEDIDNRVPANSRIREIRIRNGLYIDGIQFIYELPDGTSVDGPYHGGTGGLPMPPFILDFDEYITNISGTYGDYVNTLVITTNKRTSEEYGGHDYTPPAQSHLVGPNSFSIDVPAADPTYSMQVAGLVGRAGEYVDAIGLTFVAYGFTPATTEVAGATGWNLYVGENPDELRKVNDDPIGLAEYYDEPATDFVYGAKLPFINQGVVSQDNAGHDDSCIRLSVTGEGSVGRATAYLVNDIGYPIIMDLGDEDRTGTEAITFWMKFLDAESKSNCSSIAIRLWLSDIPGDVGGHYGISVVGEITDFSAVAADTWVQFSIAKRDFHWENSSGVYNPDLNWHTVSAVSFDIVNKDDTTGGNNVTVSFDTVQYVPVGKLNGSEFEWVFTYYNSRTNTESDFSDIFYYVPDTALDDEQVELQLPISPNTDPPLADPDKIRIYRMGSGVDAFQLAGEIDYVPGFESVFVDNTSNSMLGAELDYDNQAPPDNVKGCVSYDNRLFTWGGSIYGIEEPKNRLRYSKNVELESFPTDSFIYVGPSEEIIRAYEHDAQLFVFTTVRDYRVIGSGGSYRAVSTSTELGIPSPFDVTGGPAGMFVRSNDGIHEYPSGRKISEPIDNLFNGTETVNELSPIVKSQTWQECMEFYNSKLYFSYPSEVSGSGPTASNDKMMVWDTLYERWAPYLCGAFNLFYEAETNKLVASTFLRYGAITDGVPQDLDTGGPWLIELESGFVDEVYDLGYGGAYTAGIPYLMDTKEYDLGSPDQDKQFIDFVIDAECQGATLTLEIARDPSASAPGMHELLGTLTGTGREQTVLPVPPTTGNSVMTRRLTIRIYGVTPADATAQFILYKIIHRFVFDVGRHRTFVTPWSDYGIPTPKFFRELWIEMDTFAAELDSIEIQLDQAVSQIIAGSDDPLIEFLYANGRKKFFLALDIDQRGTLGRIKVIPTDDNEVKVYDHGFQMIAEPPVISKFQSPYSDQEWPYYKLWKEVVLDIDTLEKPVIVYFWLDGVVKESWELTTETRCEVTHSLSQDLLGKLGRITINEDYYDECGNLNGFRYYKHNYVVDKQPPDVTIADSYVQTFSFDRVKLLRRLWLTVKNVDADVNIEIYVDGKLKATSILPADLMSTGYTKRRVDLPPGIKGYLYRIVFTSPIPFQVYANQTELEGKGLNPEDTYGRLKLDPPQTF